DRVVLGPDEIGPDAFRRAEPEPALDGLSPAQLRPVPVEDPELDPGAGEAFLRALQALPRHGRVGGPLEVQDQRLAGGNERAELAGLDPADLAPGRAPPTDPQLGMPATHVLEGGGAAGDGEPPPPPRARRPPRP